MKKVLSVMIVEKKTRTDRVSADRKFSVENAKIRIKVALERALYNVAEA